MVYVVTPVHNRRALTRRFLACLARQTYPDVEVIIVDDGSTDGTAAMIQRDFPEVTLLQGDGALWWTGGTNRGLRHVLTIAAPRDYVLIINDDLEFDADYLHRLVDVADRHPRTIVGSVVVPIDAPETIWDGGRRTNWRTAKDRILHAGEPLRCFPEAYAVDVSQLTGRGMLAPVSAFREIGLYDAAHFPHRGDTEWPVRASRQGYRLIVTYDAVVKSHVDKTFGPDVQAVYHLRDIRRYFFDFRSSFWIKFRFYFALKTATSPLQFLSYFSWDLLRITVHFLRRLRLR